MSVLVIELDKIKHGSCRCRGDLVPAEIELEGEPRFGFSGPLSLDVRLSTTDHLSFHVAGGLTFTAEGKCRRCLERVTTKIANELRGMFTFPGALDKLALSEEGRREQGIFPLENNAREIDLTAMVRENIILEYPRFFQCDNDCSGLCPKCGKELNTDSCDCREEFTDSRWSKLLDLKNRK